MGIKAHTYSHFTIIAQTILKEKKKIDIQQHVKKKAKNFQHNSFIYGHTNTKISQKTYLKQIN